MSQETALNSCLGFPFSPLQRRVWGQHSRHPEIAPRSVTVHFDRQLDLERSRRAAQAVAARHEILRVRLQHVAGLTFPVQVVEEAISTAPEKSDLVFASDLLRISCRNSDVEPFGTLELTCHPVGLDRASLHLWLDEFTRFYANDAGALTPEPLCYSAVAEWMSTLLSAEDMAEGRQFWSQKLSANGTGGDAALPGESGWVDGKLAPACVRALRQLAKESGVGIDVVLYVAWASLLQRHFPGNPPTIMVTFDGRDEQLRSVLGVLERAIPMTKAFDLGNSFRTLVTAAGDEFAEYRQWQFFFDPNGPLPARAAAHCAGFEFFEARVSGGAEPAVCRLQHRTGPQTPGWTLVASDDGSTIDLELQFVPGGTAAGEALRVVRRYEELVADAVARPEIAVRELTLLPRAEAAHIREFCDGPRRDYGPVRSLLAQFRVQVGIRPTAVAVHADGVDYSYQEIATRVDALAARLAARSVSRGQVVGLATTRSVNLVVGLLAVMQRGAAYMPIVQAYPAARIDYMLRDSGATLLLAERALADALPEAKTVFIDDADPNAAPGSLADVLTGDQDIAYIIYTSGSSGRPKGVKITHANVHNLVGGLDELVYSRLPPQSRCALVAPSAFDASVQQIYPTLSGGHALYLVPESVRGDGDDLMAFLIEKSIAVCDGTPAHLRLLAGPAREGAARLSLRYLLIGGEALPTASVRAFLAAFEKAKSPEIINVYGPTECTVDSTYLVAAPSVIADGGIVPIGRPLPNVSAVVLDETGRVCPFGVPGELHLGGAGIGQGYVAAPDLTSARFGENPHVPWFGPAYRTGDRALMRADGVLEFLGRIDAQVKVRGFRIELEEIESVLLEHSGIEATAVDVRADADGTAYLLAFVVTSRPVAVPELLIEMGRRLPPYMLPRQFAFVDAIPVTSNGKIDRAALKSLQPPSGGTESAFEPPQGETEERMALIWGEVLKIGRVGRHDNFFVLGGDSIRGIQLRARAGRAGLNFSLIDLFRNPTVAQLAKIASATGVVREKLAPFALVKPIDRAMLPEGLDDAYPMSRLQIGMMFHNQFRDDTAAYHDMGSVHLELEFDGARFADALRKLIARHAVLRTSFRPHGYSELLQLVHPQVELPLEVIDLRNRAPEEHEQEIERWIQRDRERGFDVEHAPLFRLAVHLRTASSVQLTYSNHHAILDGWSVAVFITELFQTYLNLPQPAAPQPGISFSDYILEERNAIASSESAEFWRTELAGAGVPRFGAKSASADGVGLREIDVGRAQTDALLALARDAQVPIKSVFLALHGAVVRSLSRHSRLITGLVTNGRPEEQGGDAVLGLFLNTIPLRLPTESLTWRQLVRALHEKELALSSHRRYPLFDIRRSAAFEEPLTVLFNYISFHVLLSLVQAKVKVLSHQAYEETSIGLAVNFIYSEAIQEAKIVIRYNRAEVSDDMANCFASRLVVALAAASSDPDATVQCGDPVPASDGVDGHAAASALRMQFAAAQHVEPASPTERRLAEIWGRHLEVGAVGAHDNFFEIGGDSIKAVAVLTEIRKSLKARIRITDFVSSSLRDLAGKIDATVPGRI